MEDAAREGKGVGHSLGAETKSFITSLLVSLKDEVGKEKKEQLDKNDPDNYGACYAIGGHNHALTKVEDLLQRAIDGK